MSVIAPLAEDLVTAHGIVGGGVLDGLVIAGLVIGLDLLFAHEKFSFHIRTAVHRHLRPCP